LEKERAAAWIVDIQKHLQEFTGSYLSYYDSTIISGQCARMMARIRNMELIDNLPKLNAVASSIGIMPSQLKRIILPHLEKAGTINILKDNAGKIRKIEEHVPGQEEILEIAYDIWDNYEAEDIERISIQSVEKCATVPKTEEELVSDLERLGFKEKNILLSLELQKGFKILDQHSVDSSVKPLIYTPYVWGENASKIMSFISHLDSNPRKKVEELLTKVSHNQATPLDQLGKVDQDLFLACRKTGLLDVCNVSTKGGLEKGFVFTPRMWGSLERCRIVPDIYDEVKLLLSSIGFGQNYSSISKIKYPIALVEALIDRGEVGPCTAIGVDFILLEKAGIVDIKRDSYLKSRYHMYLIKEDIAKTALEILKHKRLLGLGERAELDSKGLCQTGEFVNPEQDKIRMGRLTQASVKAQNYLIKVLRGEDL